jgi:hypothetical protein
MRGRTQRLFCAGIVIWLGLWVVAAGSRAAGAGWKAGTARVVITPKQPMWMAGYAARNRPSEGAIHDLWAKALALEDPSGRRVILITLDVCGIGRELSNRVRDALKSRHHLDRDAVVLACSHTHSGPVIGRNLLTMYRLDEKGRRLIIAYAEFLENAIVDLAGAAIERLVDARLGWEIGRCGFAVNRRNNKEADVPGLRARLALAGPDDHDVPVLRVASASGSALAIVFGYACHCTVLDGYQFCGDYAGFAQLELEKRYPGACTLFVAGCGGDQNPLPRRRVELAASYGKELAECTGRVLAGPLRPIEGPIATSYEEIALALAKLPSTSEIEADTKSSNFYVASRARHLLETITAKGALETTYPYPVQAWRLGDLTWIFLGGEVVVDYSLRIKRSLGSAHTWVSAYCNDVMAYIPSQRVLHEGGYEGGGAMVYYGLPASWSDEVEETIIAAVSRRVRPFGMPATDHPATAP